MFFVVNGAQRYVGHVAFEDEMRNKVEAAGRW